MSLLHRVQGNTIFLSTYIPHSMHAKFPFHNSLSYLERYERELWEGGLKDFMSIDRVPIFLPPVAFLRPFSPFVFFSFHVCW